MEFTSALEQLLILKNDTTSHAFVYESHFKLFGEKSCSGAHIDNRKDVPICVIDENKLESRENMKKL